ncbi:MAG TPA: DNA primase [Anaerolineales bacterium]|nr:DNA primase [Anaerolineales bacterium]
MSSTEEIKARIDIVDLVTETVQLRRSGKNYTGFCPFHSNTRTPSFVVFPETGSWRCFGQCNEGGDIFRFVMKKEGWDFAETLRVMAERAGVELRQPTPAEQAAVEEHSSLRAILEEAVTFYRHNLNNTPAGQVTLEYLREKRSLKDETLEAFGLGYAPQSWDATLNFFQSRGASQEDLIACGLVVERESGEGERGVYDRFRHRIMIPIRDERGRMTGFGARVLNPEDLPKFINSPQTALFDKGRLLYGLDRARKAIRAVDQVVIVEGYLDVIALHQAGFANAVSPMGTALTEAQLRLLKRFTRRMVLALDADAAGDKATLRGLEIARQALDRETEVAFDARGLLRHEGRLQADIRVSTLPPGKDPDEVVAEDPAGWERVIAKARPIVVHVMETLAAGQDLEDAKVKSAIAAQVLPLIEDIPDPVEREAYRQRLARLIRVDERALMGAVAVPRGYPARRRPRKVEGMPRAVEGPSGGEAALLVTADDLLEAHCLSLLLRRPDMVYRVDRSLQERGLGRLVLDDFQSADHQVLLRLIEESLEQDHAEPLLYVQNNLSLPLMELADRLLLRTEKLDPNEEKVLDDLVRAVLALRKRRLLQSMDHLRFLMEEAQENGDPRASEFNQTMLQYMQARLRLDQAIEHYTNHALT